MIWYFAFADYVRKVMRSALSSAQKRRARLYNKEMTWLNLVNRASARLVDISTIINQHRPP